MPFQQLGKISPNFNPSTQILYPHPPPPSSFPKKKKKSLGFPNSMPSGRKHTGFAGPKVKVSHWVPNSPWICLSVAEGCRMASPMTDGFFMGIFLYIIPVDMNGWCFNGKSIRKNPWKLTAGYPKWCMVDFFMVNFYGKFVGKYNSPMDPMG